VLLVFALDRLSREGVEATLGLLRRFHDAGCPVWSLREPWTETADPHMAELLAVIYAWMARADSDRRSERVKAGLDRCRRDGLPIGRQVGAREARPRKRSGYVARWERDRTIRRQADQWPATMTTASAARSGTTATATGGPSSYATAAWGTGGGHHSDNGLNWARDPHHRRARINLDQPCPDCEPAR